MAENQAAAPAQGAPQRAMAPGGPAVQEEKAGKKKKKRISGKAVAAIIIIGLIAAAVVCYYFNFFGLRNIVIEFFIKQDTTYQDTLAEYKQAGKKHSFLEKFEK